MSSSRPVAGRVRSSYKTGAFRPNLLLHQADCHSGPPGCGKGTQAPKLKTEHCLCHIATGDLLRAAVAAKTPLGQEVCWSEDATQVQADISTSEA